MGMGMTPQNWEEMAAEPVEESGEVEVVVNSEASTTPIETSVSEAEVKDEEKKEA
jgi:hypothetical protein